VDIAERVPYLMLQPRDKVRAFMIKYEPEFSTVPT
jgi:hypothetical protein